MTTSLHPFQKPNGEYYTSDNVTDLNDLGVAYGPGSLDALFTSADPASVKSSLDILNSQLNRVTLAGSDPNANNPFSFIKVPIDATTLKILQGPENAAI